MPDLFRHTLRPGVIAVSVIGLAAVGVMIALPALASTTVNATGIGGYTTEPANTPNEQRQERDLGAAITVPAGGTRFLTGRLRVVTDTHLTAVSSLIRCRDSGGTLVASAITGQNALGSTTTVLWVRGVLSAPASSAMQCRLKAVFVNHDQDAKGRINVVSGTYLQDVVGPIPHSGVSWQAAKVVVNSSDHSAPLTYTVPDGVTSVHIAGDVNVTTCYPSDTKPPCYATGVRRSQSGAYVGTQLVMRQLNADGSVCNDVTNGPLAGVFVSAEVHHYKILTTRYGVTLKSSCTSRTVVAYVRVTANATWNSVVIEPNNQSFTAVFD